LVLVGPRQDPAEDLCQARNVFWLGARPHETIPSYMANFDVCLIPYRLNSYTRTVYPTKLHEYLMLGKPVVSTALPEVIQFNNGDTPLVHIGGDTDRFEACIIDALAERDPLLLRRRREAAQAHSWVVRIDEMSRIMEGRLTAKRSRVISQWSSLLQQVYRRASKRFFRWVTVTLCAYLLVFHTPLIWWIARPLKVSDPPRHADAIVVFASGVGESGRAGQGYEERVAQAVWLYKQGYAPRMILSSGYRYAFNEAEVMKALAVSLGVPSEAITLEAFAGNTHQDVRFSARIMRGKGLHSALVVSSPYHMRRLSLVWRRQAPEIQPIWAPIPYSHFFGNGRRISLSHLQAIAHEYLGILYYWWRGWI
ncbi:MAG: YdcF family protein, partial [Candidatus Omnitrophica bacterium]|nr:YdcF family protein [Candidatus Omnitrophota bacterium]